MKRHVGTSTMSGRRGTVASWAVIGALWGGMSVGGAAWAQPAPPPQGANEPPGRMLPGGERGPGMREGRLPGPDMRGGEFRGGPGGLGPGLGGMGGRDGGREGGGPGAAGERLTEVEEARFRVFMNSYMPSLWTAIQEVSSPRQRLWLSGTALFHYRRYERGRRDFPQLEESLRQDIKDMDDIIRLAREYGEMPASRQEEIRVELKGKIRSIASSMIAERRKRIERLREQVEREERALSRDEKSLDESLDTRLEEMLRFGQRMGDPGRGEPPPPGGMPPPPPGGMPPPPGSSPVAPGNGPSTRPG